MSSPCVLPETIINPFPNFISSSLLFIYLVIFNLLGWIIQPDCTQRYVPSTGDSVRGYATSKSTLQKGI